MALARPSPLLTRDESTAESKDLSAVEQVPIVGRVSQSAGDGMTRSCFALIGQMAPGRLAQQRFPDQAESVDGWVVS